MNGFATEYNFRAFQLQDVPRINELYYAEYGINYPYPLSAEFASRRNIVGSVALYRDEVIGYARACPYAGNPLIYEFGGLIVKIGHRQRTIARQLTVLRLKAVVQVGATMVFSEPVCYRTDRASQYNLIDRGFWYSGILPFKYPEIMLQFLGEQPESVCLAVNFLTPSVELGKRPIHVPPDYWPYIHAILPSYVQRNGHELMHGCIPDLIWHPAMVSKNQTGSRFVDIPVNWPESEACIEELRNQGFMFASLLPSFGLTLNGQVFDYVSLYRPSRRDFDFDLVHVVEGLSEIKHKIADEYALGQENCSQSDSQHRAYSEAV
ncbi:MAG: hypothetical protein ABIB04_01240 [Patescibacteria group bacterium]